MDEQKYLYEAICYPYNEYGLYTSLEDAEVAVEKRCKENPWWMSSEGCYDRTEEITINRRVMGWGKEEVELIKYTRVLENGVIKTTKEIMTEEKEGKNNENITCI